VKIHIILIEPEIPQNTGNIARTCAAVGATLHLVKPLGFSLESRYLKRAGLDYWDKLEVCVHEDFNSMYLNNDKDAFFFSTTKAMYNYTDVIYPEEVFLVFGKETKGISEDILVKNRERCIRIPMMEGIRSLNLSNSVAVVVFEVLRQNGFSGLVKEGRLTEHEW
jgi:tRNA (cytidine/uridine-2'-O-)-methyltransferase